MHTHADNPTYPCMRPRLAQRFFRGLVGCGAEEAFGTHVTGQQQVRGKV